MTAPINVVAIPVNTWTEDDSQIWKSLNQQVSGHPDFYPQTIKAGYVIGSIFLIAKSISWLRRHPEGSEVTYIPRYLLTASAIELLGRCVTGNSSSRKSGLKVGFERILQDGKIVTSKREYNISALSAMRHFAAHGQATSEGESHRQFGSPDEELLDILLDRLKESLNSYWVALTNENNQEAETLANQLVRAKVEPVNAERILLTWNAFEADRTRPGYRTVREIFRDIIENG